MYVFEPAHEIWVLIATGSRQSSDKPAHMCSLAIAFVHHTHKSMKVYEDSEKYLAPSPSQKWSSYVAKKKNMLQK